MIVATGVWPRRRWTFEDFRRSAVSKRRKLARLAVGLNYSLRAFFQFA